MDVIPIGENRQKSKMMEVIPIGERQKQRVQRKNLLKNQQVVMPIGEVQT